MYPMNESPSRSPARTIRPLDSPQPAIIQKQVTVTETVRVIRLDDQRDEQFTFKDRINQQLNHVREKWKTFHFPSLSKEMRRWVPVIGSVLLAMLLISLKSHYSPSQSDSLSRGRLSKHGPGIDRAAVHQKVHDAFDDVKKRVKDNMHSLESYMDHYRHYPDQNWLKSEMRTPEQRAAQLIQDLHEQARHLHIQDPTEVHYEPLTQAEQARIQRSSRGVRDLDRSNEDVSVYKIRQDYRDLSEAVDVPYAHSIEGEDYNATEYHIAKRLVHLGHDLRTRGENVPHRLWRQLDSVREQFVDGMQQLHDLIVSHRAESQDEKETGPSYHEKAQHILKELEDISHRITDMERLHKQVVKKTSWYQKPSEWWSDFHPMEWAQDQYNWVASKTFGLSEEARHRAAQAEEVVRHEAARLQELMKHELRLLKLAANRIPRQMRKASKNMQQMPVDMLEHFA